MQYHGGVKGKLGDFVLMHVFGAVDGLGEGNEVVVDFGVGLGVSVDQQSMIGEDEDGEFVVVLLVLNL